MQILLSNNTASAFTPQFKSPDNWTAMFHCACYLMPPTATMSDGDGYESRKSLDESTSINRYFDGDELKYRLRSLEAYGRGLRYRNVILVTNGQVSRHI